jgi:peptidoglycan/xylan/chitin deacetylase (PgdA/CDA1 family)
MLDASIEVCLWGQSGHAALNREARCAAYEHRARDRLDEVKRDHAQHYCGVRHSSFADRHGKCRAMLTGRTGGQPHTRSRPQRASPRRLHAVPGNAAANDHEVVLTFDDGPVPRYTSPVLETLASECVKATFFMVGQMARAYPGMVRRVYDEGHTIANHTQNHPIRKMSATQAAREIEEGFASLRDAIGDPQAVSPFFRIPGLLRQKSVEQYLAAHGDMTWSADFVADDWTRIKDSEVARRAISRIEARGKGILLLHDIHQRTVLALPEILNELKSRGYKIVHVVPAAADRPKTATSAQQWVARPTPEQ